MRKYLFKAKRVDNGDEVIGNIIQGNKPDPNDSTKTVKCVYICWAFYGNLKYYAEVIPETVGEFTGLCDKNGKRIFEGDICQVFSLTKKGKMKQSFEICYGSYHDENSFAGELFLGFFGKDKLENEVVRFSLLEEGLVENCEVIGNKYDNKELLEGKE